MKKSVLSTILYVALISLLLNSVPVLAGDNVELRLQKGHSGKINEIIFTPSGKRLISCSDDKTIKVWDVKSGKEIKTLVGHEGSVETIAINKQGTTIFSGGDKKEKKVLIWDAVTGENKGEITGFEGGIAEIKFSQYGRRIAILENMSGFATRVSVWDETLGTKRFDIELPSDFYANSIDFHPMNDHLIIVGKYLKKDKTKNALVYNSTDGKLIQELDGTSTNVAKPIYSRKGNKVALVGTNIQVWNNMAGNYVLDKTINVNASYAMFFDNETKLIFCKGNDLYKYDLTANKQIATEQNAHTNTIRAVSITLDEKYFVTAANDNLINFWDRESFTKVPHFSGVKPDEVKKVTFNSDYSKLYSVVDNTRVQSWNLEKAKLEFIEPTLEKGGIPSDLQLVENKNLVLLCGTQNKGVELWNAMYNKSEKFYPYSSFISNAIEIPANSELGTSAKIAGLGRDKGVIIWEREEPEKTARKLMGHRSTINCLVADNKGKYLFTGGKDNLINVWDLTNPTTTTFAFSINTGIEINSLGISPDGTKIIAACGNTTNVSGNVSPTALYIYDYDKMDQYAKSKTILPIELKGHTASVNYAAYTSDGKKIISGAADNKIIIWDATTWTQIKTINGHSSEVNSLTMSKSGEFLVSGSNDATTRFWNIEKKESDLNLVTFNDGNEHIVYDKNNFYTCTKNGAKNVHFVIDNEVYLFEQFDLRLNRPDLVYANMPGINKSLLLAYKKAYLKRLKKMNFTESMLSSDFNIPELALVNEDDIPYQVKERSLKLQIEANDDSYLLDRINIWINDVPLFGKDGIDLRPSAVKSLKKDIEIELSRGKNKIQLSVLNQKGAESFKITKFVYYDGGTEKNDLYVIGIGVSKFKDASFNLDYASKDATDVVNHFANSSNKYNQVYTKLILNEQATKANILEAKKFLAQSRIDDNVVVFIASHGLLGDDMDYYLATTNIDFYHPKANGLVYEDLESLLDDIPARKKLLLIDACHSGEVDEDEKYHAPIPATGNVSEEPAPVEALADASANIKSRGFKKIGGEGGSMGMQSSFELMKELFTDLRRGSGATVISSAGGKEFALESGQWNNGVFTYSFLQGMESMDADKNGDKQVDIMEIRNYVSDQVQKLTNGQQNPTFRKENLDNNYTFW